MFSNKFTFFTDCGCDYSHCPEPKCESKQLCDGSFCEGKGINKSFGKYLDYELECKILNKLFNSFLFKKLFLQTVFAISVIAWSLSVTETQQNYCQKAYFKLDWNRM